MFVTLLVIIVLLLCNTKKSSLKVPWTFKKRLLLDPFFSKRRVLDVREAQPLPVAILRVGKRPCHVNTPVGTLCHCRVPKRAGEGVGLARVVGMILAKVAAIRPGAPLVLRQCDRDRISHESIAGFRGGGVVVDDGDVAALEAQHVKPATGVGKDPGGGRRPSKSSIWTFALAHLPEGAAHPV